MPDASPDWVDVCASADVREGRAHGVRLDGEPVLIVRRNDRLHAVGGVCTHHYALLEEGAYEDDRVYCPLHGAAFDVRTGEAVLPPAVGSLPCFGVREADGRVLVLRPPPRE